MLLAAGVELTAARTDVARAQAAASDSLVLAWNQRILDAIAATKTAPTIAARALVLTHGSSCVLPFAHRVSRSAGQHRPDGRSGPD